MIRLMRCCACCEDTVIQRFRDRLRALEALEGSSTIGAGELFEAACFGGLPDSHWFAIDGELVDSAEWGRRAGAVEQWIVLLDDEPIPAAPRPLRVYWI